MRHGPQELKIGDPAPNPTLDATVIELAIPASMEGARLDVAVFDVAGRQVSKVVSSKATTGYHHMRWDLRNTNGDRVARGIYFMRVHVGDVKEVRKVLLIK